MEFRPDTGTRGTSSPDSRTEAAGAPGAAEAAVVDGAAGAFSGTAGRTLPGRSCLGLPLPALPLPGLPLPRLPLPRLPGPAGLNAEAPAPGWPNPWPTAVLSRGASWVTVASPGGGAAGCGGSPPGNDMRAALSSAGSTCLRRGSKIQSASCRRPPEMKVS